MFPEKQRMPLLDIGGQGYVLAVREGILELVESRLNRAASELIDYLGGEGAGPGDLAAIIHAATGPGARGGERSASGLSEEQISRLIRPRDMTALRAKIRAFVITAQFCRDLAEMEQAREAARWLGRMEHKLNGARPKSH